MGENAPVSAIEAIEKAMEGVTHAPGVWEAEGTAVYCDDKTGQRVASTQGQYLLWSEDQKRANASYIAACSPDLMREVLALARKAEALERERSAAETDILAERHRQIEVEGWTAEHDDAHRRGELAGAAACYVVDGLPSVAKIAVHRSYWDWDSDWWKPSDHRRNLVKAAALIIAEIERLDRARALLGGENAE